jgi:hypothetical protein
MVDPLQARVIYTVRLVFTVDVGRERIEAAAVNAQSLRHLETQLTFSPLPGLKPGLEQSARATVERDPTAAAIGWGSAHS